MSSNNAIIDSSYLVVTLLKGGSVDITATSGEMKAKTTLNIASQSLELSKTNVILDLTNNVNLQQLLLIHLYEQ